MNTHIYLKKVLNQIPRLISQLDRNPYSETYGCFDFNYWHDKIIDIPSAHSQEAVYVLALLYKNKLPCNVYYNNTKIKEWCIASMIYWTKIQHKDGSFDEFYINERQMGATAVTTYCIIKSYFLLKNDIPIRKRKKILQAIYRASRWLSENDETNTLTNHQTQALMALYLSNKIFKNKFNRAIKRKLGRIKSAVCDKCWLREYDGPDLGYLTVSIYFLAHYYLETKDQQTLSILKNAIDFSSYFLYPDGSYGGIIGSRNTAHMWVCGFEMIKQFVPIADKMVKQFREGLKNNTLIAPENLDRYYSEQMYDFIEGYIYSKKLKSTNERKRYNEINVLPYLRSGFTKYFSNGGILIKKIKNYYTVINLNKCGMTQIFSVKPGKLLFSDCGYTGKLTNGKYVSTCHLSEDNRISLYNDEKISVISDFYVFNNKKPNLVNLTGLKVFSFFFGLNSRLSNLIKDFILGILVKKMDKAGIKLTREFKFESYRIIIKDLIKIKSKSIKLKELCIMDNVKQIYVIYSKYFQQNELNTTRYMLKNKEISKMNKRGYYKIKREFLLK